VRSEKLLCKHNFPSSFPFTVFQECGHGCCNVGAGLRPELGSGGKTCLQKQRSGNLRKRSDFTLQN
jgi:hypothetical protein